MLTKRELPQTLLIELPEIGYIAFHYQIPIAVGFIRRIEGDYVMLDSYLTDPNAKPEDRDNALDSITNKLINHCRNHNVNKILAFSLDDNTTKRALKHGFALHAHVFTSLSLR